jgi:ABC-type nitrate/sulfonate/bicarbonate transport system substrate-binding protein
MMIGFSAVILAAGLAWSAPSAPNVQIGTTTARPLIRVGTFIGGRTNIVFRTSTHGYFDRAGLDVRLLTKNLHGHKIFVIAPGAAAAQSQEKKMGIEVYSKMTGIEIVDLMNLGRADAGLIGESSFISCVVRGDPIVAVALLGHDRKDMPGHAMVLRKDIAIRGPEDFKGLRLASRRAGPGDVTFLREFLASEKVDPSWVTILDQMSDDDQTKQLVLHKIDGGYFHMLTVRTLIMNDLVRLYRPLNWMNAEMSQAVLVFRRDFVRQNPEAVTRFVEAYMRRIRDEKPMPATVPSSKTDWLDRGLTRKHEFMGMSMPVYDDVPLVRPELLGEMQRLLLKYQEIPRAADLTPAIDNSFVEEADRRLKAERASAAP